MRGRKLQGGQSEACPRVGTALRAFAHPTDVRFPASRGGNSKMGAKWFGASVKRKEDPALLTGRGRYVDDINLPGMLEVAVLRSPHPHAAIRGIDTTRALALAGVHSVITYADLPESMR